MEVSDDLYRIGAVANLTGVAVERLRAWERRYGLAPAHRDGRTRYYSGAQLSRLKRIKQLIRPRAPHLQLGRLVARTARPAIGAVPPGCGSGSASGAGGSQRGAFGAS